jgi:hypothetical protein
MMPFLLIRLVVFFGLTVGLVGPVWAQDDAGNKQESSPFETAPEVDMELRGVFEGVLPGTEAKNHLSLLVHPHFGDLHRKSYLRTPIGMRYGLLHNWDVAMELEGYFSHGFGQVKAFEELGLSGVHFTTKYRPDWTPIEGWAMAARVRYTHPLDHPPVELTDGFEHLMPEITFARKLESWPGTEVFWGSGLDRVRQTHIGGALEDNEFGDHANTFSGGFVMQRGSRVYTFETTYATTALMGSTSQDRIQVRPGVIFRIPDRFTFHSRGDWRMGVAVKWLYGPDGHDFGLSVKFRGNFDLKKLVRGR